jgi:hypothetical protein
MMDSAAKLFGGFDRARPRGRLRSHRDPTILQRQVNEYGTHHLEYAPGCGQTTNDAFHINLGSRAMDQDPSKF